MAILVGNAKYPINGACASISGTRSDFY